eukprot:TRINITY_DN14295_c0_g3_i1.p1 TRINITY_DN14295_c0_g3~~TRINITY_DN14295_c0_g3_i1.p1  ORF type:complete len:414 (+),score=130.75 TRINITY_DN14295_c0_g3_i1:78-1244(+)
MSGCADAGAVGRVLAEACLRLAALAVGAPAPAELPGDLWAAALHQSGGAASAEEAAAAALRSAGAAAHCPAAAVEAAAAACGGAETLEPPEQQQQQQQVSGAVLQNLLTQLKSSSLSQYVDTLPTDEERRAGTAANPFGGGAKWAQQLLSDAEEEADAASDPPEWPSALTLVDRQHKRCAQIASRAVHLAEGDACAIALGALQELARGAALSWRVVRQLLARDMVRATEQELRRTSAQGLALQTVRTQTATCGPCEQLCSRWLFGTQWAQRFAVLFGQNLYLFASASCEAPCLDCVLVRNCRVDVGASVGGRCRSVVQLSCFLAPHRHRGITLDFPSDRKEEWEQALLYANSAPPLRDADTIRKALQDQLKWEAAAKGAAEPNAAAAV